MNRPISQIPDMRRPLRRPPPGTHLVLGGRLLVPVGLLTLYLMLSSNEPLLTLSCMVVLIIGAKMLWRVGEPPILFAAFAVQWAQISLLVIQAAIAGVPLTAYYYKPGIVTATWLSLGGLVVLASGMLLMFPRAIGNSAASQLGAEVRQYSPRKAFVAYLAAQVVVFWGIGPLMGVLPGMSQFLLSLSSFKWAFFFALAVIVMVQRRGYLLLSIAFALELALGFLSFFSDFKEVFFVMAIAAMTARPKVNARAILGALSLIAVLVVLLAAWSEVKMQYRDFLNRGTGQQAVTVDATEQLGKITDLLWNVGLANLGDGLDKMLKRIEYTEFFGAAVDYVPAMIPHTGGEIWGAAIAHIFEPRLFFPDKAPLVADVVNTEKYTGIRLTLEGRINDTEIPMGYMAESYVDFGPILMFVPIFLLGILYGAEYRYLTNSRYKLFAYGAMPVVFEAASEFGLTAVKILGGNLTVFGATYLALRFIVPTVQRVILARQKFARV